MFSTMDYHKVLRPRPLAIGVLFLIVCAGLIVFAKTQRPAGNPYRLAEDLPRGALVYAQFRDLPALLKQWDESHLKEQYLGSTNYGQFQHSHLALKLMSRWEEFNSALGFQLDTAVMGSSTEASAAIGIYDIGKLDLVLIAPMSEEKLAATKFFQAKDGFEETELSNGATYYRHDVEADRGRQKQALVFATLKGRFILATNEQLLVRTIANLNHESRKDALFDDPAFKTLSAALAPHFATVWVDQAKLNEDYYFKHYWLMQNTDQLKGIRAGLFDLEMQDGRWIEHREFITVGKVTGKSVGISSSQIAELRGMIPDDVPFLKVCSVMNDPALVGALARDTLFDRREDRASGERRRRSRSWSGEYYDEGDDYADEAYDDEASYNHYAYLGRNYDKSINDSHDAGVSNDEEPAGNPLAIELDRQFTTGLELAVAAARPQAALVATSPHTVAGPLFVEFRKVVVLTLQAPESVRRDAVENAISAAAQGRLTVAGPTTNMKWVSRNEAGQTWRILELPMLGWELCYAFSDHALVIANSVDLLKSVLARQTTDGPDGRRVKALAAKDSFAIVNDLTVIRLDQRKQAFDDIMNRLDADSIKARHQDGDSNKDAAGVSEEFFSGSIASLLNVTADVASIEIRRDSSAGRLREQLDFILK